MRSKSSLKGIFLLVTLITSFPWGQTSPETKPLKSVSPQEQQSGASHSEFADVDLLLQQGKYDEAIAQLQDLAAKKPTLKGLSHEIGIAYYQKGDFIKA